VLASRPLEDFARCPPGGRLTQADLLRCLAEVAAAPVGTVGWQFRTYQQPNTPLIVFGAGPAVTNVTANAFAAFVLLRHTQYRDLGVELDDLTVGVVVTPSKVRPWDTSMVATSGGWRPDAETLGSWTALWGVPGRPTKAA